MAWAAKMQAKVKPRPGKPVQAGSGHSSAPPSPATQLPEQDSSPLSPQTPGHDLQQAHGTAHQLQDVPLQGRSSAA